MRWVLIITLLTAGMAPVGVARANQDDQRLNSHERVDKTAQGRRNLG